MIGNGKNMVKIGMRVLWALCGLVLAGCTEEVSRQKGASVKDASERIQEFLKAKGWEVGVDDKHGRTIVIGNFVAESGVVDESVRQMCFRKAFDDAVNTIAGINDTEVLTMSSDVVKTHCHETLYGVIPLANAEVEPSNADALWDMAVAVMVGDKFESMVKKALKGAELAQGKKGKASLDRWLERQDFAHFLGAKSFVDDKGDMWLVGSVSDDGKMLPYLKSWAKEAYEKGEIRDFKETGLADSGLSRRLLKGYALWTVARMLALDVECTSEVTSDDDVKIDLRVAAKVRLDANDGRIKWFERKTVSPISNKTIKVLLCAIRLGDVARMESVVK